jgi:long-chain acyl-CoA synthetase
LNWGRNLATKRLGAYEVRILEPRPTSLLAFLAEAAKWSQREFVIYDGRRISFAQFIAATEAAAQVFAQAGIRAGDVVLLNGANSPEWLLSFWGLIRLGATVAQGNAWWSASEVIHAIELLSARALIADERRRALVTGSCAPIVLALEDLAPLFNPRDAAGPINLAGDEEDPAVLVFTSGTTGKPKAAVLSHRAVVACLHNIYCYRGKLPQEFQPDEPQRVMFCCNPLFHIGGLLLQSQALLSGHKLVLLKGRASGEVMLDIIETERVNILLTVPTLLSRVVDHPDAGRRNLSSVVSFSAAGAPVNPELMEKARRVFPSALQGSSSTYGMTESGGSVTMIAGTDYLAHKTSAGRPLPACELRIGAANADGVGEILIRAPSAMTGYWASQDPIIDEQGWIHTGDLGCLDAEGYLYVTGRSKDIIIRGGENVSPVVIEQRLSDHPAVAETAVIGLAHPTLGEEVAAVVTLKAGAEAMPAELARFVSEKLAYFQVPTRWWLRREPLPTNASGKIMKAALRSSWPSGDIPERATKPI